MNNIKVNETNDKLTIEIQKKENHTLDELEQKLVNCLYEYVGKLEYRTNEIELLKIIFDYKKSEVSTSLLKVNPDSVFVKGNLHLDKKEVNI